MRENQISVYMHLIITLKKIPQHYKNTRNVLNFVMTNTIKIPILPTFQNWKKKNCMKNIVQCTTEWRIRIRNQWRSEN